MKKSFIMTVTVISFLIFLSSFVSSAPFTFDSPDKVSQNSEFATDITANSSETYDVKITVTKESKIISEIYYSGWKNPYYYLRSAYPSQTSFKVRVINSSGEAELCVRLRKSGKSSYSESCKSILIKKQGVEGKTEGKTQEKIIETTNNEKIPDKSKSLSSPIISQVTPQKQEKIVLNQLSPSSKSNPVQIFNTKEGNIRTYSLYFFLFLCIIIIILLSLKKL